MAEWRLLEGLVGRIRSKARLDQREDRARQLRGARRGDDRRARLASLSFRSGDRRDAEGEDASRALGSRSPTISSPIPLSSSRISIRQARCSVAACCSRSGARAALPVPGGRESGPRRTGVFGFRYDTLEGHIERGVEWFLLTKTTGEKSAFASRRAGGRASFPTGGAASASSSSRDTINASGIASAHHGCRCSRTTGRHLGCGATRRVLPIRRST